MEYKHEFLDELSYLPEVNVWLDRYYSDSVRTYLDRFDQKGYSRSFFLDEHNMDGEKQTDLDFIYKSTLFYEEYFKSLLDSSLIDDTNKSFIVSGIEKIKQMNMENGVMVFLAQLISLAVLMYLVILLEVVILMIL